VEGSALSHGGFYIPRLFKYLPKNLDGLLVLDAGSGIGEVAYYVQAFTGRPACDISGHPRIIGVDINAESVQFTQNWLPKIYEDIQRLDLADVEKWAKMSGLHFDMAWLLEVPEHIPKEKMLSILDQVERIADYILIATPYGDELNQDYGDVIPEFNHVSVWMSEDFTQRGYKVAVEDVTAYPRGIQALRWVYAVYRRLRGKKLVTQRKIIAVRNPKGLEVSGGLNFAGLRGKV
jgi:SAM-dependent methyltransferase